ncbi:MAG: serine/threonine-protein kinase, partial [Planctomycetota bacterium]
MAVTSAKEFLDLLEKSRLLGAEKLQEARAAAQEADNAVALARRLVEAGLLTDWQGAQLVAGRSSFLLGKYRLIRLLGRGGMGGVFLAEHTMMNRRVALKTISRDFGSTPGSLEQFLLEARTIAALDHPNIVQAYSFDQEGGRFFLVMEYIGGQDLEQIVEAQGPLEGSVAADYIRQAAEGLQHGHERKIIHCDIKPSNLLLNEQGVVKIVDMGMSR